MIASATRFFNAVKEEEVTHFDQAPLNDSATHAIKRNIGKDGGWGWGSNGDSDSTPIEAASLAYWGVVTTKRNPGRKTKLL